MKENEHLPNLQTAEQILERPRPKSDPPRPPAPGSNDEVIDQWGADYGKWAEENSTTIEKAMRDAGRTDYVWNRDNPLDWIIDEDQILTFDMGAAENGAARSSWFKNNEAEHAWDDIDAKSSNNSTLDVSGTDLHISSLNCINEVVVFSEQANISEHVKNMW